MAERYYAECRYAECRGARNTPYLALPKSHIDNGNNFNFAAPGLFEAPERVSTEDAGQVAQVLGMFSDAQSVINSQTSWYQIG
jgi:hypothetical protein